MSNEELQKFVDEGVLSWAVAEKYLSLYLGAADWETEKIKIYNQLLKRYGNDRDTAGHRMKEVIACAVLLPIIDRGTKHLEREGPEQLFEKVIFYSQFHDRDWVALLKEVVKRDIQINHWRTELVAQGVIDPIDHSPVTRQAYKWLCEQAETTNELTSEAKVRFRKIVAIYGGVVISNIFTKHPEAIKKVFSWRHGYFFERLIFNIYSLEQLAKIKRGELEKTNSRLIHKVNV
ncbi:MAG TPA: hypothetical protein VJ742_12115 [Nitrososphaera sp.]|nr:hypothetical protein [Nitrososphaera sp.]